MDCDVWNYAAAVGKEGILKTSFKNYIIMIWSIQEIANYQF